MVRRQTRRDLRVMADWDGTPGSASDGQGPPPPLSEGQTDSPTDPAPASPRGQDAHGPPPPRDPAQPNRAEPVAEGPTATESLRSLVGLLARMWLVQRAIPARPPAGATPASEAAGTPATGRGDGLRPSASPPPTLPLAPSPAGSRPTVSAREVPPVSGLASFLMEVASTSPPPGEEEGRLLAPGLDTGKARYSHCRHPELHQTASRNSCHQPVH